MSEITDTITVQENQAAVRTVALTGTPDKTSATDVKTIIDGQAAIKVYNLGGGGGDGKVRSVNGKDGDVVLAGEDIMAVVSERSDTVQGHLQTLSNDIKNIEDATTVTIVDWSE